MTLDDLEINLPNLTVKCEKCSSRNLICTSVAEARWKDENNIDRLETLRTYQCLDCGDRFQNWSKEVMVWAKTIDVKKPE